MRMGVSWMDFLSDLFLNEHFIRTFLVVAAVSALGPISNMGRGKKRKRDYELIIRRLANRGFGGWMVTELLIYIFLAAVMGFCAFGLLWFFSEQLVPSHAVYRGHDNFMPILLAAMFIGMSGPAFMYVPVMKMIHKKRFRKVILYSMAFQRADTLRLTKFLVVPIFLVASLGGLGSITLNDAIVGDRLIEGRFLSLSAVERSLRDAKGLYIVKFDEAPSGKQISRIRILLEFSDGHIWESREVDKDFSYHELRVLGAYIASKSGLKLSDVTYSPIE